MVRYHHGSRFRRDCPAPFSKMLLPKARHPRNCRQSQSHAVAQLNLSAKLRCPGHRPGFYGMLYVESENPVTGPDTAILAGDHNARPGQSFECRRGPRHRKYPEFPAFWLIMKSVGQLVDVRRAGSGIGVAKFPYANQPHAYPVRHCERSAAISSVCHLRPNQLNPAKS